MAMNTATLYSFVDPVKRNHAWNGMKKHSPQFSKIATVGDTKDPIREFQEDAGVQRLGQKAENATMDTLTIMPGAQRRIQAATYAAALQWSKEILSDMVEGQNAAAVRKVTTSAGAFGKAVAIEPEYLFAQMLDRSFDSSYPVTVDGVNLCSASHLTPYGATQSNIVSAATPLSEVAIEDIKVQLRAQLGPEGTLTPTMLDQMIVPGNLSVIMEKLATSTKTLGSANNDPSVVKGTKYQVFDYLTNSTRYFAQTDAPNGFFWDWRQRPTFDDDTVILALQVINIAYFRAMWGCENYRAVVGVNATL